MAGRRLSAVRGKPRHDRRAPVAGHGVPAISMSGDSGMARHKARHTQSQTQARTTGPKIMTVTAPAYVEARGWTIVWGRLGECVEHRVATVTVQTHGC